MSFLTPWFLLAMTGIAIPIAIHMIRRKKAVKVVFTTLRFLKTTSKRTVYFQQIQQWLLLLVRTLIFVLLALAFARPFLGAFSQIAGLSPQSVVILLDRSMSMRYGDHFARAKAEALQILQSLQTGDEAALVTFSESTDHLKGLTTDLNELESFLKSLDSPDYRETQYLPALKLADQILSSAGNPERTIYLVSDFQRQAFESPDTSWQLSPGITLKSRKIGNETTSNLAVTDVKSPNLVGRDEEEHTILGKIRSLGSQHVSRARVSLMMERAGSDLQIIETRTVELSYESEAVVVFHATFESNSDTGKSTTEQLTQRGAVVVEDDQFPPDNTYHFTVNLPSPIHILAVNGESDEDWYDDESHWFRLAMGEPSTRYDGLSESESPALTFQSDGASNFQLEVVEPHQFDRQSLNLYKVIVLLNVRQLGENELKAIQSFVSRGGNLLIALGDRVEVEGFNRFFSKMAPAVLEEKKILDDGYLVLADVKHRHPVFQALRANADSDFGTARFKGYWLVTAKEESEILMQFDNGKPALVEQKIGRGRVLLFTSSLDIEWSNLPLQVWYLPWLHETFRYLSRHVEKKRAYVIDEPVSIHVPARTLMHVISPLGEKTVLTPHEQFAESGERHFYSKTQTPGFYHIRSNNFQDYFAVNTSPKESDLTSFAPQALHDLVVNPEIETRTSQESQTFFYNLQADKSQRFWWWLLLFVVLLGIGETILANRTFR